jgi:Flp pilus assembly protein TadG
MTSSTGCPIYPPPAGCDELLPAQLKSSPAAGCEGKLMEKCGAGAEESPARDETVRYVFNGREFSLGFCGWPQRRRRSTGMTRHSSRFNIGPLGASGNFRFYKGFVMRAFKARARGEGESNASRRRKPARDGNIIVLTAFMMVIMMAMVALAVDVGYVYTMQAQLQRSVDAAALAGAGELVNGIDDAQTEAKEYLVRNPVGSTVSVIDESALEGAIIQFETDHADDVDLKVGNWNPVTRTFEETQVMPSTMRVSMTYPNMPFFFARTLGHEKFTIRAESTAMFQPRDIMVVLDFSASMNDDSTFAAIGKLPQATVEQSLLNCWADLGVSYGNLPATPTWATAHGVAENVPQAIPHVSVQYRYSSVYVTSTQSLSQVKLEFSNGAQQTWTNGGTTGTYAGTGGNAGKQVRKVWVKSWNNHIPFGSNGEYFDFTKRSDSISSPTRIRTEAGTRGSTT